MENNNNNKKTIIITAIISVTITAFIAYALNKDDFTLDKAYLEDLKSEIKLKDETITEFENHNLSTYEEKLNNLEGYLDDISDKVDAIYEQTVPDNLKDKTVYDFEH